jgi:hypothetical protein
MTQRLEARSAQNPEGATGKAAGSREKTKPPGTGRSDVVAADLSAEVDAAYGEIREVVLRCTADPSLKARLEPLRRRLEELEELEADAMERRLRSQLVFDPAEGRRLLERAEALLKAK